MADQALPPQNLDAEECVIGSMLISPAAIESCIEIVSERDFYRQSHGVIFDACVELYARGEAVDAITVEERLATTGRLKEIGGKQQLHQLSALVPTTSNAGHHAKIVREHSIFRDLIRVGSEIQALGWDRPDAAQALVEMSEQKIFELSRLRHRGDFSSGREAAGRVLNHLQEVAKLRGDVIGLSTGFDALDRMTSGLRPGNLIVVAGRPSMGKSAIALGMAAHAVLHNDPPVPIALFTLEMSETEVYQRLFSMEGFVDGTNVQNPSRLDTDGWSKVTQVAGRFYDAPLYIDDTGATTMSEIRSKARRLKLREPNLGLVVLDYIQLMSSGGARTENRNVEISQISRGLKLLASELGVPILALSQLSRDCERRHDKRPLLSDLRDSGSLEQDADLVMFVYRDEYYFPEDPENAGIAEIILAKQRNGPTGMRKLSFVSRYARFSDLPMV